MMWANLRTVKKERLVPVPALCTSVRGAGNVQPLVSFDWWNFMNLMRNFKQIGESQLCVTEDRIPFQGDHDSWFKENSYKEGMIISYTAFLSWFTKKPLHNRAMQIARAPWTIPAKELTCNHVSHLKYFQNLAMMLRREEGFLFENANL